MHEDPFLFNYKVGDKTLLKHGMVIAIEPMLNLGVVKVEVGADDWTVSTIDNSLPLTLNTLYWLQKMNR